MFLLILESIGTSELILIAVVALIVFGPRKLPQMAKTLGKTMAEFRNATNEFKTTWEREVAFDEDDGKKDTTGAYLTDTVAVEKTIVKEIPAISADSSLAEPKVRELSEEEIKSLFKDTKNLPENAQTTETQSLHSTTKKDWL